MKRPRDKSPQKESITTSAVHIHEFVPCTDNIPHQDEHEKEYNEESPGEQHSWSKYIIPKPRPSYNLEEWKLLLEGERKGMCLVAFSRETFFLPTLLSCGERQAFSRRISEPKPWWLEGSIGRNEGGTPFIPRKTQNVVIASVDILSNGNNRVVLFVAKNKFGPAYE